MNTSNASQVDFIHTGQCLGHSSGSTTGPHCTKQTADPVLGIPADEEGTHSPAISGSQADRSGVTIAEQLQDAQAEIARLKRHLAHVTQTSIDRITESATQTKTVKEAEMMILRAQAQALTLDATSQGLISYMAQNLAESHALNASQDHMIRLLNFRYNQDQESIRALQKTLDESEFSLAKTHCRLEVAEEGQKENQERLKIAYERLEGAEKDNEDLRHECAIAQSGDWDCVSTGSEESGGFTEASSLRSISS